MNIFNILDFLFIEENGLLVKDKDLLAEVKGFLKTPKLKEYVHAVLKDKYVKDMKEVSSCALLAFKEKKENKITLINILYKGLSVSWQSKITKNFLEMDFPLEFGQQIKMKYFFKTEDGNFYAEYEFERKYILDEYFFERCRYFDDFFKRVSITRRKLLLSPEGPGFVTRFGSEFSDFVKDGNELKFIKNSLKTQELSHLTKYFGIIFFTEDFDFIFQEFKNNLKDEHKKEEFQKVVDQFKIKGENKKKSLEDLFRYQDVFKETSKFIYKKLAGTDDEKKETLENFFVEFMGYVFKSKYEFVLKYKEEFGNLSIGLLALDIKLALFQLVRKVEYIILEYNLQNEENLDKEVKDKIKEKCEEYKEKYKIEETFN